MINNPFIAGYVSIVLLFDWSIKCEYLINCWFLSPYLITTLCQHEEYAQYQYEHSIKVLNSIE